MWVAREALPKTVERYRQPGCFVRQRWYGEGFSVCPFEKHEAPLMKSVFESNQECASFDPSFGVFELEVYKDILKQHSQKNFCLRKVLNQDCLVMGYFHLNCHQAQAGVCWISMLSIHPDFQRCQLGSKLYASIVVVQT